MGLQEADNLSGRSVHNLLFMLYVHKLSSKVSLYLVYVLLSVVVPERDSDGPDRAAANDVHVVAAHVTGLEVAQGVSVVKPDEGGFQSMSRSIKLYT